MELDEEKRRVKDLISEQASLLVAQAWEQIPSIREDAKMRIAFYDRLVLLSGSILTLSFTAAASLVPHLAGNLKGELLSLIFVAWKLLLLSLGTSLLANKMAANAAVSQGIEIQAFALESIEKRIRLLLSSIDLSSPPPDDVASMRRERTKHVHNVNAKWQGPASVWMGRLAQLLTFAALGYLYVFATRAFRSM